MKKESSIISNNLIKYDIGSLYDVEKILFLDIETTGLSAVSAFIYMVGLVYHLNGNWHFESMMAESPAEEETLLRDLLRLLDNYEMLIHFNGNTFDLPFIRRRCEAYGLSVDFDTFNGLDIYRRVSPYKHMLGLSNCKQKTIESYLGVGREDKYSGGELIHVYREYVKTKDEDLYDALYTHNHEDLLGMLQILPILSITGIADEDLKIDSVKINTYKDVFEETKREVLISFILPSSVPRYLSSALDGCYLSVKGDKGMLKVPIYQEELKYFFENYKDYYYLPEEDMAVHKSVSVYVDKAFRNQATPSTCYVRKEGDFLPQWDGSFSPIYKREYDSPDIFTELNEAMMSDDAFFTSYARHVISHIISG